MNEGMKAECQQKVQNFNHARHLTSGEKVCQPHMEVLHVHILVGGSLSLTPQ